MNWRIFEHFLVLGLALLAIVMGVLWHQEKKEQNQLDFDADVELDEATLANANLRAEVEQLTADLTACRDRHVTKTVTGPLDPPEAYPSPRERFKPKPQ